MMIDEAACYECDGYNYSIFGYYRTCIMLAVSKRAYYADYLGKSVSLLSNQWTFIHNRNYCCRSKTKMTYYTTNTQ